MLEKIKEKIILLLTGLAILSLIVGTGLFFAFRSTEPEFRNKIDKIIYERKNKSPKYVLTLPDKIVRPSSRKAKEDSPVQKPKNNSYEEYRRSIISATPNLAKLPDIENPVPLKYINPVEDLEKDNNGLKLPTIAEDGRKAWEEYASPPVTVAPMFFKVAIVVKGAGLDRRTTNAVIDKFPAPVALSFSPYGSEIKSLIEKSRLKGHETYVDLYLSSKDFLKSDSGPLSMSITASQEENLSRFYQSLNRASPVVGIVINRGIADENSRERLQGLLTEVRDMGLAMVDATGENGVAQAEVKSLPRGYADIVIDEDFSRENIQKQIENAEILAQKNGKVVIAVAPKPVVLQELYKWVENFSPQLSYEEIKAQNLTEPEHPFALVPLSAVITE